MKPETLRAILSAVSDGSLSIDDALRQLRRWPIEDLGFARVDHHRHLRRGVPEVVFGDGKRPAETLRIAESLAESRGGVLVTRAPDEALALLEKRFPEGRVNRRARTFALPAASPEAVGLVAVVAAGTSDLPVAEEATETARAMGAQVAALHDVGVAGLHRLLPHLDQLEQAHAIVVVAGMEGALPSVVAGLAAPPVIAVPTSVGYGASFGGLAALLAMLNSCASGVVVVNIDNGFGAGFSAALINRAVVHGGSRARDAAP
ncbi:MAG: nickel pincer cofactor biosynthesis protein LarB [Candidatus Eisenbacteria bacterium]|nr:nickel pincer cofactor biosynthesis protein LarB [Candidatus Eisenbacteria bacterium]